MLKALIPELAQGELGTCFLLPAFPIILWKGFCEHLSLKFVLFVPFVFGTLFLFCTVLFIRYFTIEGGNFSALPPEMFGILSFLQPI